MHDVVGEAPPPNARRDLHNLRMLLPYLWEFRGRVLAAMAALVLAKIAVIGIPIALKEIVDALDAQPLIPVWLLLGYGALRLANALFTELRDVLFARVRQRAMRRLTTRTLAHLHNLSLRFHLERRTGAITQDLQRGARSLSTLLNYLTFSILPVLVEFGLGATYLALNYDALFTLIILGAVIAYVAFTLAVTNWRMAYRHRMNQLESRANNEAVDGLINYETVKYFGNERLEVDRCDQTLHDWEDAAVASQSTISILNFGQGAIITVAVTGIMLFAAAEVTRGNMTLGDLVLVNTLMLQLFIPLNFLGVVYRQIRYAFVDMDQLVRLLERSPEIQDHAAAAPLPAGPGGVRFESVSFAYQPERPILFDVSLEIRPGRKLAIVGRSGAGKSTLARLLLRFYDVTDGQILIDGTDIRRITQSSLRAAIGVVPQDTVLFNESLMYNLRYGRPSATDEEVVEAARQAQLDDFIAGLPDGYATVVGERGLKLSGGEKQRVAIARALLKQPRILVFDEATSALDTLAERAILSAMRDAAAERTTLVIAHRLSTVVDADEILVLERGRIIERGSHPRLLAAEGHYAELWRLQQHERSDPGA